MKLLDLKTELKKNAYPGRGIICGKSPNGKYAVFAYFIMGRSENSRNRIFEETEDGIKTKAFDESKMKDPSLIIYNPVRRLKHTTIVTNGDQTDTIFEGLLSGFSFEESLRIRKYEPDDPNFTPRISAALKIKDGKYRISMSILKSDEGRPEQCVRNTFTYDNPISGEGRFIHTYMSDGDPLISFEGEPKRVDIFTDDMDEFLNGIWESLNEENKVSLYGEFINLEDGSFWSSIINKNS